MKGLCHLSEGSGSKDSFRTEKCTMKVLWASDQEQVSVSSWWQPREAGSFPSACSVMETGEPLAFYSVCGGSCRKRVAFISAVCIRLSPENGLTLHIRSGPQSPLESVSSED